MLVKKVMALLLLMVVSLSCSSSSSDSSAPAITFEKAEGKAVNGQFTINGNINSSVSLLKVVLTKEGTATPFIVDDSTAKNKNSYAYSYLVTGITADTVILIDVYNQNNVKTSSRYLIRF